VTAPSEQTLVRMGEVAVARRHGVLVALGLGSCVAVLLHDAGARVGALAHVLLPSQSLSRNRGNPARAADTAVPHALAQLRDGGAEVTRVTARLVGGASMFQDLLPTGAVHIGERNLVACRTALRVVGVPIVGEAVGGQSGRSVWFDVEQGRVIVRSVGHEPIDL
jgi:chemotaxis protein CheD